MPNTGDQDDDWFAWLAEAQDILSGWEAEVGRMLRTQEAVALIDRVAQGLQRSFERGKSQSQDD